MTLCSILLTVALCNFLYHLLYWLIKCMVPWIQSSSNSTADEEFTKQDLAFDSNKSTTGQLEKDDPSDTLISSLSSADDAK